MSVIANDASVVLNQVITVDTQNIAIDYLDWIVLVNSSALEMQGTIGPLNFQVPAWYYYPVALRDSNHNLLPGINLPLKLTPTAQTIPGASGVNTLHTTLYRTGEMPLVLTPTPLGGSPINLAIATSVVNINNPPATPILFAEPVGDTSANGAANLNNQGQLTLGDSLYNGALTILGTTLRQISLNNASGLRMLDSNASNAIDLETDSATFNGSTSGSATLFEPFRGTAFKLLVVSWTNLQTTVKTLNLANSFSFGALFWIGELGSLANNQLRFLSGGVAVTCSVQETISATGAGGTQGPFTVIRAWSNGQVRGGFDQLELTMGSAAGGLAFIVGY